MDIINNIIVGSTVFLCFVAVGATIVIGIYIYTKNN